MEPGFKPPAAHLMFTSCPVMSLGVGRDPVQSDTSSSVEHEALFLVKFTGKNSQNLLVQKEKKTTEKKK